MSSGTPVGGGFMRQRHSQGYGFSSDDDLEDDASSRVHHHQSPEEEKMRTWVGVVENCLWITSVVFIVYYGDQHSNFIYLLWQDDRIRRIPLYLGMVGVGLNLTFFLYTSLLPWSSRKFSEKWDFSITSALPFVTLLGIISFCLFSFALWPIWSFLTLPLLFTLFMAGMVLVPHLMLGTIRPQTNELRVD
ncbi:uncharacterized protein LOC130751466 isoform X2 [Actinidia eriantha]|uniref:uncharacterized protein LOC130751466 isoform X2 n=1 Tax=Actinidia eriantha TaxID=165200 RepID=UPI00258FB104|nr:uncharacterized protein LOC130751466 isoform X2 [Actinidia eriantha]XP_057462614.1 uncharacterized protein LOC130751466 isoform X2 [Actinidia eriantha]XP_057463268.1 uncharacterized protein LOC130751466 isoform X2 [Actinidia eriantha]XP_057463893.1 uncharacterized protein LOC130751466 isoform X2 [Actinidia eriantha]